MTTRALAVTYVESRRARGEITTDSARQMHIRLGTLITSSGDGPIEELDRHAIDKWQRTLGKNSVATRNAYLSTVRGFCRWLVIEGHVEQDPALRAVRFKEPRRVPRALPSTAIGLLLAHAPDKRTRAIIWLMVGLGLRRCEVARLDVGDWDRWGGILTVRGKSDHERVLPVPPEVAGAVSSYLDEAGWSSGPLLRNRAGKAMSADQVSNAVTRSLRSAGLKRAARDGVSPHALRHTAASDVLDRCHDVRTVQEMMGHVSIATTQIYLRRANLDQLRAAMGGRDYGTAA